MNRTGLILAITVVLASNIFVLIGVSGNRSGVPFETIELTERELTLQSQPKDDSGISLYLNWKQPTTEQLPSGRARDAHFDSVKLQELGVQLQLSGRLRIARKIPSAPRGLRSLRV